MSRPDRVPAGRRGLSRQPAGLTQSCPGTRARWLTARVQLGDRSALDIGRLVAAPDPRALVLLTVAGGHPRRVMDAGGLFGDDNIVRGTANPASGELLNAVASGD